MKILFVTDLIPLDDRENCAKALIPIIKRLEHNNIVDIVRPNFLLNSVIRGKEVKPEREYNYQGLKIKNINFNTPFWFESKTRPVDISEYDEIIAHMPSGILYAERLVANARRKNLKIPQLIYAVHQSDIQVLTSVKYSIYFRFALKNAYRTCDKIVCRAPHLKQKLLKILPECEPKITVKISKIPPKYFISEEEMFAKIKAFDGIKFITAANLIKRKNIDLVLAAFSKFKEQDFSFEIIGDGKEFKKLKKKTYELGLEDKVIFSGKLSHEEVLSHMQSANVFILPSVNETLGLVYLEASACGCLCIGCKDTGIDGIFQDNINCFLCEPSVNGVTKVLKKTFSLTVDDFKNLLANRNLADFCEK